jgi:hypothetical protein
LRQGHAHRQSSWDNSFLKAKTITEWGAHYSLTLPWTKRAEPSGKPEATLDLLEIETDRRPLCSFSLLYLITSTASTLEAMRSYKKGGILKQGDMLMQLNFEPSGMRNQAWTEFIGST